MRQFFRSFRYALRGLRYAFQHEHNCQIEVIFAFLVLILALAFQISPMEQSFLVIAICIVLSLELLNTAIERLVDMAKPRMHPYAKLVKDIMAGAVLVSSFFALLIGLIIFFPRIATLLY